MIKTLIPSGFPSLLLAGASTILILGAVLFSSGLTNRPEAPFTVYISIVTI